MAYIHKENFLKECAKTFGNPSLTIKAIAEIAERNTVEAAESAFVETELDCTIADRTKTDCLLYDKEKRCCKGLKDLYCAKGKQCAFYKNGKEKPKKKRW